MNDELYLEKFYAYRTVTGDEKWGACILDTQVIKLPNVTFGMKIFANNEKEAISKAKKAYDRIHTFDSDKENVRRFAAAGLKYFISKYDDGKNCDALEVATDDALKYAVRLNDKYMKHFNELEGENNE